MSSTARCSHSSCHSAIQSLSTGQRVARLRDGGTRTPRSMRVGRQRRLVPGGRASRGTLRATVPTLPCPWLLPSLRQPH
eukprot:3456347-Rhodomonas_salina.1